MHGEDENDKIKSFYGDQKIIKYCVFWSFLLLLPSLDTIWSQLQESKKKIYRTEYVATKVI